MPGTKSAVVRITVGVGGDTIISQQTITDDNDGTTGVEIGPAKTGTLTTRTDANTGTLTMAASHGITTGARLDLYWDGGMRRGITVGTVSVNSVPIDLGSGDDLPIATTAITAMVPDEEAVVITGDDVSFIAFGFGGTPPAAAEAQFVLADSGDAELFYINLDGSRKGFVWCEGAGENPVAGDAIAKVFLSHGDSTAARTLTSHIFYS